MRANTEPQWEHPVYKKKNPQKWDTVWSIKIIRYKKEDFIKKNRKIFIEYKSIHFRIFILSPGVFSIGQESHWFMMPDRKSSGAIHHVPTTKKKLG